nr:hypothetical protein Itr_chr15CG11080 [Ipomoea trifida]
MSRMAAKLRAPTSISEVMASGRTEHSNRQQQRTWLSSPPALVLGNVQSSSEPPLIPTSRSSGGDCVFFQFPLFFLPTAEFNSGSLLWFRQCKAATRSGVKELVETKSYKPAIFGQQNNNNTLLSSLPNTTTAGLLLLPLSHRGGGCRRSCCPCHHCLITVDEGRAAPLIYFLLLTLDGEGKTRERITLLQLFVKGNHRCCLPLVAQLSLLFHTNSPSISFEAAGEREERSRICHPSQLQLLCSLGE